MTFGSFWFLHKAARSRPTSVHPTCCASSAWPQGADVDPASASSIQVRCSATWNGSSPKGDPVGYLPCPVKWPRMPLLVGGQDPVEPATIDLIPSALRQLVTRGLVVNDHVTRYGGELGRLHGKRHHQGRILPRVRIRCVLHVIHNGRLTRIPGRSPTPGQHRPSLRLAKLWAHLREVPSPATRQSRCLPGQSPVDRLRWPPRDSSQQSGP